MYCCRKVNKLPLRINQSSFRDFRVNPSNIPYRNVFLDYIGPVYIKKVHDSCKSKIYLLCITCIWCRAINFIICADLSVSQFMRAFQLHCFEYGVPEVVHSDLGTQIVAAGNTVSSVVTDPDVLAYCSEQGISPPKFHQFPKGNKKLGGLVESCAKMVKRLLYGAVGKNVLTYLDFEFVVKQVVHIVNKRPIGFKEYLRTKYAEDVPVPLTPDMHLYGHELPSFNLIPELQECSADPEWYAKCESTEGLKISYKKLAQIRTNLTEIYNGELFQNLIHLATDKSDRYVPAKVDQIKVGDIVLVREENTKRYKYPMAIVTDVETNYLKK